MTLVAHLLEIPIVGVDQPLRMLHIVGTETMNLKTTAFSVALIFFLGQPPAWSQVQWATPGHDSYPQDGESFDQPVGSGMALWPPDVAQASCDDCAASVGTCACASCRGGGGGGGGIFGRFMAKHRTGGGIFGGRGCRLRMWADAEYLLWWSQDRFVPALATTSPVGTPQAVAGRLGQPTTSILYGNDMIGGDAQSGYRGSVGFWLDQGQTIGLGARFFYVGDENNGFMASSTGNPILARPFFNADPAVLAEDALLVAFPGISTGTINIDVTNVAMGGDLYLRKLLLSGYCNRLDLIGGYQRTDLDDEVLVGHSLVSQDPAGPIPVGTLIDSQDRFKTENQFDGGFIGLMTVAEDGRLTWRLLTKVAFGNMKQSYTVSGSTVTTVPALPALSTNNGPANVAHEHRLCRSRYIRDRAGIERFRGVQADQERAAHGRLFVHLLVEGRPGGRYHRHHHQSNAACGSPGRRRATRGRPVRRQLLVPGSQRWREHPILRMDVFLKA